MLVEALNILIENAFQAVCKYVEESAADVQGRLSLVCRPADKRPTNEREPGEVLLEFRNSSGPIDEEMYKHLAAQVPQPMTRQMHAKGSRKKGGSGFGHYFARRVISSYCGGQEWRRQLDAMVEPVNEDGLVCIRVNLLEPDPTSPAQTCTRSQVRKVVQEVFKSAAVTLPAESDGAARFSLPANVKLNELIKLAKEVLVAAREDEIDTMFKELQNTVGMDIKRHTYRFRDRLRQACSRQAALVASDGPRRERLSGLVAELADEPKSESFRLLCAWLLEQDQKNRDLLEGLARDDDGQESLWEAPNAEPGEKVVDVGSRDRLRRFLEVHWQAPADLFSPEERAKLRKEFVRFGQHLKQPADTEEGFAELLLQTFEVHDKTKLSVPVREKVAARFKPAFWSVREEVAGPCLCLTVRLSEGQPSPAGVGDDHARPEVVTEQVLKKDFTANLEGRKFLKFRRSLEALNKKTDPVQARLELKRFPPKGKGAGAGDVPFWEVRLVLQALQPVDTAGDVASATGG
jgi:hypothetical protein